MGDYRVGGIISGFADNNVRDVYYLLITAAHGSDHVGRTAKSTIMVLTSKKNALGLVALAEKDSNAARLLAESAFKPLARGSAERETINMYLDTVGKRRPKIIPE